MSVPGKDPEDELAGTEQPFVTHLVELRDRLIRAFIAIGICFGMLADLARPGRPLRPAGGAARRAPAQGRRS